MNIELSFSHQGADALIYLSLSTAKNNLLFLSVTKEDKTRRLFTSYYMCSYSTITEIKMRRRGKAKGGKKETR